MPVILVPTPPRYLALPRWVFWRPKLVFLPVKKHTRGIESPHFSGQDSVGRNRGIASAAESVAGAAALLQIAAGHHRIVRIHPRARAMLVIYAAAAHQHRRKDRHNQKE